MAVKSLVTACTLVYLVIGNPLHAAEKLQFQSYDPANYAEVLNGKFKEKTVQLFGYLELPKGASGKAPILVIVPGSGGYQPWMQRNVADFFNENGIGTFIIDPFTSRGVKETATDQARVSHAASVIDAIAAYKMLRELPTVDGNKIAITGMSRGGTAAVIAAESRLRKAVLGDEGGYAGYTAMYPGCALRWRNPSVSQSKVLLLLGERDDYTDPKHCVEYAQAMSSAGASVSVRTIKGAYHGWAAPSSSIRWLPGIQVYGGCATFIEDDGSLTNAKSGKKSGGMTWNEWAKDWFKECGKWGATVAGGSFETQESNKELLRFLQTLFVQ